MTVLFEILFTKVFPRWAYSEKMPILPGADVGVVALSQWIVIPLLVVWFVNRQIAEPRRFRQIATSREIELSPQFPAKLYRQKPADEST